MFKIVRRLYNLLTKNYHSVESLNWCKDELKVYFLMKKNILFKTTSGNNYFFNQKNQCMFLTNPIFQYLLRLQNQGVDLNDWINNISQFPFYNEEIGNVSFENIKYYIDKLEFLERNGQLDSYDAGKEIKFEIGKDFIKGFIANSLDVAFEVTEKCNLDCTYCVYGEYYEGFEKRTNKNLSFEKARNLLNFLFELSESSNLSYIKEFDIGFYGGEPLVNLKLIKKIVDYSLKAKLKRTKVAFSMTTNGVLLSKYMSFLHKHNFGLLISLDGNEENNAFRKFKNGSNSHSVVFSNIKQLQKEYPDFFDKNVQFNVVLHKKNDVEDVYQYFFENFKKIPSIIEVSDDGLKKESGADYENLHNEFNEKLSNSNIGGKDLELLAPSSIMATDFLIQNNGKVFKNYNNLLFNNIKRRHPTGTCMPFTKKLFLTAKGIILPCENVPHNFKLGEVSDGEVSIDYQEISKLYEENYQKIFKQCKNCYSQRNCSICFMQLKENDHKVRCSSFSNYQDYADYLAFVQDKIEKKPDLYIRAMKEISIT